MAADGANQTFYSAAKSAYNFQFSRRANWLWQDKILSTSQHGKKIIIVNQSKLILVIVLIKTFTCQSFKQNIFSGEKFWVGGFYWDCLLNLINKAWVLKIIIVCRQIVHNSWRSSMRKAKLWPQSEWIMTNLFTLAFASIF